MPELTGAARGNGSGRAFSLKDRVDHTVFGLGKIVKIDRYRTTVAFDRSGTRTFVTGLVELAASDAPLPARRTHARKNTKSPNKKTGLPT